MDGGLEEGGSDSRAHAAEGLGSGGEQCASMCGSSGGEGKTPAPPAVVDDDVPHDGPHDGPHGPRVLPQELRTMIAAIDTLIEASMGVAVSVCDATSAAAAEQAASALSTLFGDEAEEEAMYTAVLDAIETGGPIPSHVSAAAIGTVLLRW